MHSAQCRHSLRWEGFYFFLGFILMAGWILTLFRWGPQSLTDEQRAALTGIAKWPYSAFIRPSTQSSHTHARTHTHIHAKAMCSHSMRCKIAYTDNCKCEHWTSLSICFIFSGLMIPGEIYHVLATLCWLYVRAKLSVNFAKALKQPACVDIVWLPAFAFCVFNSPNSQQRVIQEIFLYRQGTDWQISQAHPICLKQWGALNLICINLWNYQKWVTCAWAMQCESIIVAEQRLHL